jgi:cell division septum initiation protein DivIVA
LLAENETLKAVNDELSKELASLSENSLQAAVDKAKKTEVPTLSAETFEVEETRYGFVSPVMMFEKKRITNADVLASKELQAKLVAAKSGMIKAVS